ncbi:MAG: hypothetical protein ACP5XB_31300 [Isosphaeraceae bacterium]
MTGALLLLVFKHTSNQAAIKRVRAQISASTLALKLFKDSAAVALRAQGRMLWGAFQLFFLAIVPMLVMMVPVVLILGQLSLWYQARPLSVGEEALVWVKVNDFDFLEGRPVNLAPTDAVEVTAGPVRVHSKREIYWNIKAKEPGNHLLEFTTDNGLGPSGTKRLAIGDGFMRLGRLRPGWHWEDVLLNPSEAPFPPGFPIQSIEVDYPARDSWTSGTNSWIIYWFGVSMIAALAARRVLNVNL